MNEPLTLAAQAPAPTTASVVRCHISSYTLEIHDFYGDVDAVLLKMGRVDMGLTERRMFLLSVQTAATAELRLFEHVAGTTWAVSRRIGDTAGVTGRVADMIFINQGKFCVGESTQKLLGEFYGPFDLMGNVEVTDSGVQVFGPVVNEYGGQGFLKVTAGLLC